MINACVDRDENAYYPTYATEFRRFNENSITPSMLLPKMSQKGFTIIELITIIVVLGVLAVSAVPIYFDLTDDAQTSAETGVVGKVRSGIMLYFVNSIKNGNSPSYPAALDGEPNETEAGYKNPLFVNVLHGGVTEGWLKKTDTEYRGPAGTTYVYSSENGTFLEQGSSAESVSLQSI